MTSLYPVSSTRVSDQLTRTLLTTQLEAHRSALFELQGQISTGQRIQRPSDDSPAAIRAIALQRLLEQKEQIKTNLSVSQSFVSATDSALSTVAGRIAEIRARAVEIADSSASVEQRELLVQELQASILDLVNIGNQQFRGRYLFAGSTTGVQPFEAVDGHVIYRGNERSVSSFIDIDFLSATNVSGNAVFGAISEAVRGTADLDPALSETTRLSRLNGGAGVTPGTILISDGTNTQSVDLSSAATIADVIRLISANPPPGRTIDASISSSGLILDLDDAGGGSLTVYDTSDGRTALDLGIRNPSGAGVAPLIGDDLDPRIELTTQLADLLGARSSTRLDFSNDRSDLIVEANENGPALNGTLVRFIENTAVGDQAIASYDSAANELVIDISQGATTAATVVSAINATGVFSAALDTLPEVTNDGSGLVELSVTGTTSGGSGVAFDQSSGLQVNNGDQTHVISFDSAETVEDLLNTLNHSSANLLAEINQAGTGIDVRSRLSGSDFQIGENGGTTATELGLRTFSLDTELAALDFGRGVDTAAGGDFVIQRKDGSLLEIDISSAESVEDVISLINGHPDNTGDSVTARLAVYGNGIELFDGNVLGSDTLTVTRGSSFAAWGLGLIEKGADSQAGAAAAPATATLTFPPASPANTAMSLSANKSGYDLDGVEIVLADTRLGDVADASYDSAAKQLTINIDVSATTANTIISAINLDATFSAALETTSDPGNDGTGVAGTTGLVGTTAGGADERVLGRDTRPAETHGIFNSLIRLRNAVADFDLVEIGRAADLLDEDYERLNLARGELGVRGQLFDLMQTRVEDEEIELRSTLSEEIDTDMVQAISDLTARQTSFEATLQLLGRILQLTVLDFI